MTFFDVVGWDVPSKIIPASKKRKREVHLDGLSSNGSQNEDRKKSKNKEKLSKSHQTEGSNGSKKVKNTTSSSSNIKPAKPNDGEKTSSQKKEGNGLMTNLQVDMKNSLEGARFRWINEMLYTTDSSESHQLLRKESNMFQEYHCGFRRQVLSWPQNPVQHFISVLSNSPPGTVVVDLGCGEAALAKSLIPKGICVLSYDLVLLPPYVLEADICQHVPLPGSETTEDGHVVDICVCILSLMSTNWVACIRECWRILKMSGSLQVAEVTSRFTDIDAFIDLISSIGFKLKSNNKSNTHFVLFEFTKVTREHLTKTQWSRLITKHGILKPCEYKRR